ncbi:MAG TPA: hypothetical protein VHO47_05340 [Candidatus Babeliales bacterium]|nr:hypothetical protein [Candidatus Babeliales bacterium]
MENNKPFAEVIESSLTGWLAQSWNWNKSPSFGSIVTIETNERILFGIVYQIRTGSIDPVRYPFTYQKTEAELMREQPQIFEFLKTTFSCLIAGYYEKNHLFYQLAPEPPKIHAFVQNAHEELHKKLFSQHRYLHLIFALSNNLFNLDELLLALLKEQSDRNLITQDSLEQFIETFSLLTGNDYRRLKLFLQRVDDIVQ